MAAGDVWRLSCIGDWGGQYQAVITQHIRMKSGSGTFAGAAAYIKTNLLDLLKTYQTDNFYWRQINGLSENLTPPQSGTYTTGFPLQGASAATEQYSYQVAAIASIRTAYAGRSYRGRQYIPGLTEGGMSAFQLTSTVKNAFQTYYDDLVAALGSGGSNADYEWVVWSKKLSLGTLVNDVIVRANVGTQRRRMPGVGA